MDVLMTWGFRVPALDPFALEAFSLGPKAVLHIFGFFLGILWMNEIHFAPPKKPNGMIRFPCT